MGAARGAQRAGGADLTAEAPLGSFNFKETLPADGPAELTAGDYQIRVGVGTPGDPGFLLAFDSGTVTLADGADLVIAAVPSTFGSSLANLDSPVSLVLLASDGAGEIRSVGTEAALPVVHASNNTPAIGPLTDVVLEDGGIYTVIARDALPGDAETDLGVILIDDTPVAP